MTYIYTTIVIYYCTTIMLHQHKTFGSASQGYIKVKFWAWIGERQTYVKRKNLPSKATNET